MRRPGEWLFHPSERGNAMRTGEELLLGLTAWIDHLGAPPPVLAIAGGATPGR